MKIIVPMAGMGKRMRPHTLTVPKPLIKVAGKPIVQRLVEDIAKVIDEKIDEIAFVIGDFGKDVENQLLTIAKNLGANGSIHYQHEALGTAHAILCAEQALSGKVIVAFADTLFKADFKIETAQHDGIIWVQKIEDPTMFGVVKVDKNNVITDFVEKPQQFVSDLAIIGIYYFKDGEYLRNELQYLIDNNIKEKGEYQLTNALENMKQKGAKFLPGKITEWLDCGNKDATVYTNSRVLTFIESSDLIHSTVQNINSVIIPPCYIGENVIIEESVVGPYVSIGANTKIKRSNVSNSIIQNNTQIINSNIENSMVGAYAEIKQKPMDLSISDYSVYKV
ncbi:MAG: NTP transferase domain-containing protein [Bacteroidia bacterium]|nr:NTP transferase domain-containing protein [Bacteroidia bacterium]MCZ2248663.1 NTP transferase domain-containing protein [Bacteroidia bacterium]